MTFDSQLLGTLIGFFALQTTLIVWFGEKMNKAFDRAAKELSNMIATHKHNPIDGSVYYTAKELI